MLTKVEIKNFRCFKEHCVPFRPTTILVGKNNVGKSTLIEILKVISITNNRYQKLNYKSPPEWSNLPLSYKGVYPSVKNMQFNTENIFYRYGKAPAEIIAYFDTGQRIHSYIGADFEVFAVIYERKGKIIKTKQKALREQLPLISVLPQVGPLKRDEKRLEEQYVRTSLPSSISHIHFRNQLDILNEYWEDFKKMSEETWAGLGVVSLDMPHEFNDSEQIGLLVRDKDFVSEIGWMGHGLQMWLQTIWFLVRTKTSLTIAMDEPDVYMHADLQKQLIRLLKTMDKQIIIATHSIEIMSEVEPSQVLVVNGDSRESVFLSSTPGLQDAIYNIGGATNLQMSRLWNAKRCILVEGGDLVYLKKINDILDKGGEALDNIPNFPIGGWGGWNYAIGSKLTIHNMFSKKVRVYCLLDRDYHTEEEVQKRKKEAEERDIELHIWSRKEIENYFVTSEIVRKVILYKSGGKIDISVEEITKRILDITNGVNYPRINAWASRAFVRKTRIISPALLPPLRPVWTCPAP